MIRRANGHGLLDQLAAVPGVFSPLPHGCGTVLQDKAQFPKFTGFPTFAGFWGPMRQSSPDNFKGSVGLHLSPQNAL